MEQPLLQTQDFQTNYPKSDGKVFGRGKVSGDFLLTIEKWTPAEVGQHFLSRLGLTQYLPVFEQHGIGGHELIYLTRKELKQIIPVVGHRITIYDELQGLKVAAQMMRKNKVICEISGYKDCYDQFLKDLAKVTRGLMGNPVSTKYVLTNAALKKIVTTTTIFGMQTKVDNIDLSTVTDIGTQQAPGRFCQPLTAVTVRSTDQTSPLVAISLLPEDGQRIEQELRRAWEADQAGVF